MVRGAAVGTRPRRRARKQIEIALQLDPLEATMHQAPRARNNLPPNLAIDPLFDALRSDPRYAGSAR